MIPIRKLYIDSRFKSPDSKSNSNFYVDLPQVLLMPESTGFYLDDISIPVAWYAVGKDRNDHLYYKVNNEVGYAIVPEGNYTLISLNNKIVQLLNGNGRDNYFVSTPNVDAVTMGITITINATLELLTDEQLVGAGFTTTNPMSINNVLRNLIPKVNTHTSPYVSGYIDLIPIRNIYITSTGLGNFNTLSISGERAIVKKVPVTSGYGEIIHDQTVLGIDFLDCSHQTLSRIGFQLKDVFGNEINLNGQHWSFSIVFSRIRE